MKRVVVGLVLTLVVTVAPQLASDEAKNLKGLRQSRIVVAELHPEAREIGISLDNLTAQVRERLRDSVPWLVIHQAAQSYVYVSVSVLKSNSVSDQDMGCTTLLQLQVYRPVTILNDELGPEVPVALVAVWEKSVLLGGDCGGAPEAIKTGLDTLLRSLVADYSTANP